MVKKCSKFDENYTLADPNPKHKNMKRTTPRQVIIKLLKVSDKQNIESS